jgi:8-oxo-dGTP pyrophosphatase MutT (NUDIX family)
MIGNVPLMLPVPLQRLGYRLAYSLLRVYWFFARPRLDGVKCVLTDGTRVLLVLHTYGRREWDLPGGMIKRHELPSTAATREMEEELGISIERWRALNDLAVEMDHRHGILHCFHAGLGSAEFQVNRAEIERTGWFQRDQLPTRLARYVRPILAELSEE